MDSKDGLKAITSETNVVELLKIDHRLIATLFENFAELEDARQRSGHVRWLAA
ncbi:hypothetical protein BH10CYA1_BH10CYA1_59290 [soil metagenome]